MKETSPACGAELKRAKGLANLVPGRTLVCPIAGLVRADMMGDAEGIQISAGGAVWLALSRCRLSSDRPFNELFVISIAGQAVLSWCGWRRGVDESCRQWVWVRKRLSDTAAHGRIGLVMPQQAFFLVSGQLCGPIWDSSA